VNVAVSLREAPGSEKRPLRPLPCLLDHQESYLTGFFGFMGVSDIAFVRAEGVNLGAEQRARALESALAEVATLKAA
jgi:FMN-dependent NADH-azoreductase